VSPADAFVEDKYIIHISEKSFDNTSGHNHAVRSLYFNVEGNRTDFIIWPHKKRINEPLEDRKIAEPFSGLNGRPPEFDSFCNKVSTGTIS
jgi:predicted metal-dependent enzyme (double-stranded beta helix superfamily)